MRKEINIFFNALMFYTRIPCPKWVKHDAQMLNDATRYFPFIGWIVGGICAVVYLFFVQFYASITALIISFVVSIFMTGAFHEDGFADSCDAFGGGWTKEKILAIMKDSRLGTYGSVGLILMILLKISSLYEITAHKISDIDLGLCFISAHALSRFIAATFVVTHDYARAHKDSKSKPIAQKISQKTFCIMCIFGLLPVLTWSIWANNWCLISITFPLYLVKYRLGLFFEKWLGGYTGDCLGATQQIIEVLFYLIVLPII